MSRLGVSSLVSGLLACHHPGPGASPSAPPSNRASFEQPSAVLTPSASNRTCSSAELRAVLGDASAPPATRVKAWEKLATTCDVSWVDYTTGVISLDGVRARVDLARGLLDSGRPFDCRLALAELTTPYSGGLASYDHDGAAQDPDSPLSEVEPLDERCAAAVDQMLTDFHPATCTGASAKDCFSVDGCSVEQATGAGRTALVASDGPLTDEDFCCGLDQAATTVRDGKRYLRVSSREITRVCSGGTAARALDAIYEVRGDHLVLVADYTIALH
jgi:hypothetical protein